MVAADVDLEALRELGLAFGLLNRQWRRAHAWRRHVDHNARGEHWAGCEWCLIASTPAVRRCLPSNYHVRRVLLDLAVERSYLRLALAVFGSAYCYRSRKWARCPEHACATCLRPYAERVADALEASGVAVKRP